MWSFLSILLIVTPVLGAKTFYVEMRDGVKLHTLVDFIEKTPRATIIDRSPYGPYFLEMMATIYGAFGFNAIRQDMRGTGKSEGLFNVWYNDTNDGVDTLEWIVQQPWSNGDVYGIGLSADGISQFTLMQGQPPSLKKQFIIWAASDGHMELFPGGVYRKGLTEMWLKTTDKARAPLLTKFIKQHEAPSDYWDRLNVTQTDFSKVTFPSVHWLGWYDIFLGSSLKAFEGYRHLAAREWRNQARVVVAPLGHCYGGWMYFYKRIMLGRAALPALFGLDLFKGKTYAEKTKTITFFVMGPYELGIGKGLEGNFWTTMEEWPEYKPVDYYLHSDGRLVAEEPDPSGTTSTSFIYDPKNPVPTKGGNNLELPCGPKDQTELDKRDDVLVFQTDPLEESVVVTGPLKLLLYVSTNCTDTDFMARLSDVWEKDKKATLIQEGQVRMRWRPHADFGMRYEKSLLTPGKMYEAYISLLNTSYVFNKAHRIRIAISSSNYPRFSANPNNGLDLLEGENGPFLTAENTVYHSVTAASRLTLPTVTLDQLPRIFVYSDNEEPEVETMAKEPSEWDMVTQIEGVLKTAWENKLV